jgi:hypothetical protein
MIGTATRVSDTTAFLRQAENLIPRLSHGTYRNNDSPCFRGGASSFSRSILQRERPFLMSHSVHHFAIIAMILKIQNHDTPLDSVVAPSTLAHEREGRGARTILNSQWSMFDPHRKS